MAHLIECTILVDTEYKSEAERIAHKLWDVILDEDDVLGLAMAQPKEGSFEWDAEEGPS